MPTTLDRVQEYGLLKKEAAEAQKQYQRLVKDNEAYYDQYGYWSQAGLDRSTAAHARWVAAENALAKLK